MKPLDFDSFIETLKGLAPPKDYPLPLQALWWDAKGDWNASHDIAQEIHSTMGSWIHAYLHRKEGDEWNARYWYRQACRPFPDYGLDEELKVLVEAAL
ncbi:MULTISPECIES: hypothetical protein [Flavobacteriaceae]|uniref:hypothetical protein n=1 Tax=Flavobacteriaceae TaxID=49546 RepID=UPI0014923812|nr:MULTISPECIES: hypothetical protein [Allomuricauda]MDC6364969.1 hypothetical protein [Muricauda sp. AC10]